ncbi:MAG: ABC transporter substrate-binding protein [Oscillospiraceae bacterium]|nr:ABC transporter substrate-binding protein [Oscillospiraceae bacterium]
MKNRGKRQFIVLLALIFLLAGCAKDDVGSTDGIISSEPDDSSSQQTASAALTSFSLPYISGETWNPTDCSDGTQQVLGSLLYEGLFVLDRSFAVHNVLCDSYTVSADFTSYTFNIRSGVTFSDGSALSASDVSSAVKSAMSSARYGARLSSISSVSAGNGAVTIALKTANNDLPALLDIPVVKASTADDDIPVGTGPYVYAKDDDGAYLAKNANWWQGKSLPLERIELTSVTDSSLMPYQFSSREFHFVTTDLTATGSLSYSGDVVTTDAPTTILQYIGFNCQSSLFSDAAVRSALSLGVDRNYIVSAFLLGHAQSAAFPVSPASALYPSSIEKTYSSESFASAMSGCGMNSGSKHRATMIVCSDNSFKVSAAKYIASALSLYDIDITVEELPYDQYAAALGAGNFDLYYGEVKMTSDFNCSALVGTGGSLNYGGFSDAALDMLIKSAAAAPDSNRSTSFLALQTRFQSDEPIIPIAFKTQSYVMPDGAADDITPTAACAFYDFSSWKLHING